MPQTITIAGRPFVIPDRLTDQNDIEAILTGYSQSLVDQPVPFRAVTGTSDTLQLADVGMVVTRSNAAASTGLIPANASAAIPVGKSVTVLNLGAGVVTYTPDTGVTVVGAPSLTLAQGESITFLKTGTNTWIAARGGGLPKALVSGSTGSPTTGNYTSGPDTFDYWKWTGSGTVTSSTAGLVDVLAVGGGGGGGGGFASGACAGAGGGAGAVRVLASVWLPAGTHTVTIGAGGAGGSGSGGRAGADGAASLLGPYVAQGGGAGGSWYSSPIAGQANGRPGGSGGGGSPSAISTTGASGTSGEGFAGGNASASAAGGGGGAGAVGAAAVTTVGGAGGAGVSNSYNNAATTYGGGGGGGTTGAAVAGAGGTGGGGAGSNSTTGTAGTANTGGGGGGGANNDSNGGAGGSGIVILRIAR